MVLCKFYQVSASASALNCDFFFSTWAQPDRSLVKKHVLEFFFFSWFSRAVDHDVCLTVRNTVVYNVAVLQPTLDHHFRVHELVCSRDRHVDLLDER